MELKQLSCLGMTLSEILGKSNYLEEKNMEAIKVKNSRTSVDQLSSRYSKETCDLLDTLMSRVMNHSR